MVLMQFGMPPPAAQARLLSTWPTQICLEDIPCLLLLPILALLPFIESWANPRHPLAVAPNLIMTEGMVITLLHIAIVDAGVG